MRESVLHFIIILGFTGVVFFSNLGGARLWDRDEPRNAGCAAEMLERGDWVVPIFNDELRHQKPVLLYWLMMSAYSVMGVNEFSARFWSALLGVGTVLATYGIARRLISPRVGLYAALALSTSLMFDVAARAATPDSLLAFCGTTTLLIYVVGTFVSSTTGPKLRLPGVWFPRHPLVVLAMYVMMGLGVLAKGPVGFVLPMAIIGLFMLIQTLPAEHGIPEGRQAKWKSTLKTVFRTFHPVHFFRTLASMHPLVGAIIILAVAAPWYVLVDARTEGDFTRLFFVGEHFGRATRAMENHNGGIWFYPLAILVGFFPWSIFWGPVAVGLWKQRNDQTESKLDERPQQIATTLMLCWVVVQVGAFTLAKTKLPSYVTPCYPALAVLTSACLVQLANSGRTVHRGWFYAALGGLVFSGLAITLGVGWATLEFLPSQTWLAGLGLIPLIGGVVLIWMLAKGNLQKLPAAFSVTSLLFCAGLFGLGTVSLDAEQQSHQVLNQIPSNVPVGTYRALESSWVFYAGQPLVELSDSLPASGSTDAHSSREKFWHPKPQPAVMDFFANNPDAMLITTDEHFESLADQVPDGYEVIQSADYFLRGTKILLIGRPESGSTVDGPAKVASQNQGSQPR